MEVFAGSLAQKAGLQAGDVVMTLDGKATDDPQAFADAIYAAEPGKPLKLIVKRGEEELEFEVKLD
jgi:S1-C subfamily serine protease